MSNGSKPPGWKEGDPEPGHDHDHDHPKVDKQPESPPPSAVPES